MKHAGPRRQAPDRELIGVLLIYCAIIAGLAWLAMPLPFVDVVLVIVCSVGASASAASTWAIKIRNPPTDRDTPTDG